MGLGAQRPTQSQATGRSRPDPDDPGAARDRLVKPFEQNRRRQVQLHGVCPEIVGVWRPVAAPGWLAVRRAVWAPLPIAARLKTDCIRAVQQHRRGRRLWHFQVEQGWAKARATVAVPHGHNAGMRAIVRLVARLDVIGDPLDTVADERQGRPFRKPRTGARSRGLAGLPCRLDRGNRPLGSLSSRSTAGHAGGPPPVATRAWRARWPHPDHETRTGTIAGRRLPGHMVVVAAHPPDQSARRAPHAASDTATALAAGVRRG